MVYIKKLMNISEAKGTTDNTQRINHLDNLN